MQVPEGWKLTSLGDVCPGQLQTGPFGSQLHAHEYTEEGVAVLMPKDLIGFRADIQSAAKISEVRATDLAKHKLQQGDLLFSRRGDVARFALIDSSSEGALCGTGCLRARPSINYNAKYLSYFLQQHTVKKWLEQNAVGQTMPNMNTEILSQLPLKLATDKNEQQKIAQVLSSWDKAITATEQLLANSQQQKKALMQQLLTGKRRLLDDNGQRFSGEWKKAAVEKFFEVGSSKRVLQADWKTEGVPFYRTRELVSLSKGEAFRSEVFISNNLFVELSEQYGSPKTGDFLVSGVGTLGVFYQVQKEDKFYFKDGNVLWFKLKDGLVSDYFKYSFQSELVQKQIDAQASVTTVGTYTIKNAKKTVVLYPTSLLEQQKIAAVLTATDQEIAALEQKLEHLKQEKKSLMQQLLTGKTRVKITQGAA